MSSLSQFSNNNVTVIKPGTRARIKESIFNTVQNGTVTYSCASNEYFMLSIEYNTINSISNYIKFGSRVVTPNDTIMHIGWKNKYRNNMIKGGFGESLQIYSNSIPLGVSIYKMELV